MLGGRVSGKEIPLATASQRALTLTCSLQHAILIVYLAVDPYLLDILSDKLRSLPVLGAHEPRTSGSQVHERIQDVEVICEDSCFDHLNEDGCKWIIALLVVNTVALADWLPHLRGLLSLLKQPLLPLVYGCLLVCHNHMQYLLHLCEVL